MPLKYHSATCFGPQFFLASLRWRSAALHVVSKIAICVGMAIALSAALDSEAEAQVRYYRRPNVGPRFYSPPKNYSPRYRRPQPVRPQSYSVPQFKPAVPTPVGKATTPGSSAGGSGNAADAGAGKASNRFRATPDAPRYVRQTVERKSPYPRIAGDYEKQKAILLSVCELLPTHENVLVQIVNACEGHVTVGILVDDRKQLMDATKVLMKQNRNYQHVKFYHLDLDTIWLRDFGPRIGELEGGGAVSFDFLYEGTRPLDEKMPKNWSKLTRERYHSVPWTMQGGNLLFNGQGLALTTQRIFEDNHVRFEKLLPGTDPEVERREMVINEFKRNCNLSDIVVLEPLRNEATRHVDMFAAFVAADHVVVASLDRRADPVNAAVLDRNARKLEAVEFEGKPLKVTRMPTPAREGKYWSTFTNVIFANDLVILPSFSDNPPAAVKNAVAVYKSVLPNHEVKVIDTSTLKKLEGSVHCMSINVPAFAKLPPKYLSLTKAIAYLKCNEKKKADSPIGSSAGSVNGQSAGSANAVSKSSNQSANAAR